MGGTGKTQVIKALIKFFEQRNKSHHFLVLAPTSTAAALLSGCAVTGVQTVCNQYVQVWSE